MTPADIKKQWEWTALGHLEDLALIPLFTDLMVDCLAAKDVAVNILCECQYLRLLVVFREGEEGEHIVHYILLAYNMNGYSNLLALCLILGTVLKALRLDKHKCTEARTPRTPG